MISSKLKRSIIMTDLLVRRFFGCGCRGSAQQHGLWTKNELLKKIGDEDRFCSNLEVVSETAVRVCNDAQPACVAGEE